MSSRVQTEMDRMDNAEIEEGNEPGYRLSGGLADTQRGVAAIYEDADVAESYLQKRMRFAWQRLLHRRQIEILKGVVGSADNPTVLELAPGPARLATDLRGIRSGVMVENSEEMIRLARRRLADARLDSIWTVLLGSAFDLKSTLGSTRFDLVYTFRFIRHFQGSDRGLLYRQIHTQLKKEGLLVFDVVNREVRQALDAQRVESPKDELPVYDASFAPEEIRIEMRENGFSVAELHPVVRHFGAQSWLSHKGHHRAPRLAGLLVDTLEQVPSRAPLEWVAVCIKE